MFEVTSCASVILIFSFKTEPRKPRLLGPLWCTPRASIRSPICYASTFRGFSCETMETSRKALLFHRECSYFDHSLILRYVYRVSNIGNFFPYEDLTIYDRNVLSIRVVSNKRWGHRDIVKKKPEAHTCGLSRRIKVGVCFRACDWILPKLSRRLRRLYFVETGTLWLWLYRERFWVYPESLLALHLTKTS